MPTFLGNSKMHPALRARIERSVTGRTPISHEERPATRAWVRGGAIAAIFSLAGFLWISYRTEARELEAARTRLLAQVQEVRGEFGADELSLDKRIGSALSREAGSYSGDLGQLASIQWLNDRSSATGVYVRLSVGDARERDLVAEKSLESSKDALLDCFMNPPQARDEKTLLMRVRQVYGGSNPELVPMEPASKIFLSAIFLSPSFLSQIQAATSQRILNKLSLSFSEAHLSRLAPALKARFLIAALDEPKNIGTPSELDGAARHFVRLAVIDLRTEKTLFRRRREVDPSWISNGARFRYALGLDGCLFGRDVRIEDQPAPRPTK